MSDSQYYKARAVIAVAGPWGENRTAFEFDPRQFDFSNDRATAIREFCLQMGQGVAYTLACFFAKSPIRQNGLYEKINITVPQLPIETAVKTAVFEALANFDPVRSRPEAMAFPIIDAVLRYLNNQPPKPTTVKDGPTEIVLRTFDFS